MKNASLSSILLILFLAFFSLVTTGIIVLPIYYEHFSSIFDNFLTYFQLPLLAVTFLVLTSFVVYMQTI